ncbi:uncharacterized protein LOC134846484 [Symsagittifera roscoffensis]|uniref:uncharacterized protein LOC134846484 n=1 Tax=Symsagittifera roscoffensis TaxID=84072 RepID=UPI00307C27C5
MKTCETNFPPTQKRSDIILHRLNSQQIHPNIMKKKSPSRKPNLIPAVDLDSLKTIEDCYEKLVQIVPKAESKMGQDDLIGCVIDYISELEDELLRRMDFGTDLRLEDDSDTSSDEEDEVVCGSGSMVESVQRDETSMLIPTTATTISSDLIGAARTPLKNLDDNLAVFVDKSEQNPFSL